MEYWAFVDERVLRNWKRGVVSMVCQQVIYGDDKHCHTIVGCKLRQKQLQQRQHLRKRCKLGAPIRQKAVSWSLEACKVSCCNQYRF